MAGWACASFDIRSFAVRMRSTKVRMALAHSMLIDGFRMVDCDNGAEVVGDVDDGDGDDLCWHW